MYFRHIIFSGPATVWCDGRCHKAWGINCRPRTQHSDDPDDYTYLSDSELGTAPDDPGTYEGGHAKPSGVSEGHNKWCARECERSLITERGAVPRLPDMGSPRPNMVHRRSVVKPEPAQAECTRPDCQVDGPHGHAEVHG